MGRSRAWLARAQRAVSACIRILYARKLTYSLYFVASHSGVNHSLRVGFPEGSFSNVGASQESSLRWRRQSSGA
jgi:hypothetical protein